MPTGHRPLLVSGGTRPLAAPASQPRFQGPLSFSFLFRAPPGISTHMDFGGARLPGTERHVAVTTIRVRQRGTFSFLTFAKLQSNAPGNRSHCLSVQHEIRHGRDLRPLGGSTPITGGGDRRPPLLVRRISPGLCPGHIWYTQTCSGQRDTPPPVRDPVHILLWDAYGQARALLICGGGSVPAAHPAPSTPSASWGCDPLSVVVG